MSLKASQLQQKLQAKPITAATIYFSLGGDAREHCVDRGHHWPGVLGPGPVQHAQGGDGARIQSQSSVTHLIQSDQIEL